MIHLEVVGGVVPEKSCHGAFTSYRAASDWLIEEGFEPYYNNTLSKLFEEDIITFYKNDLIGKMYANIENYKIYQ